MSKNVNHQNGFTMIELMIVVAIVAILAMVAYPSYQSHVTKTRRSDGYKVLNEVIQAQERYRAEELTFSTDLTDLGYGSTTPLSAEEYYQVTDVSACASSTVQRCVVVTATPQGAQAGDGALTLNTRGEKTGPGW